MSLLLVSDWSPTQTINLDDGITIHSHHRAQMVMHMGSMMIDTINVEFLNEVALKKWLVFHTFALDVPRTLNHYETEGYDSYKLEVSSEPNSNMVNFNDILPTVYFNNEFEGGPISYAQLYKIFLSTGFEYFDQIVNFYTSFGDSVYLNHRRIRDTRYWQLVIFFSIIDSIIDSQPYCQHDVICNKIKTVATHYPITQAQWLADKLFRVIGNEERTEEYMRVIETVRKKVRNSTVHASLVPPTKPTFQFIPGHQVYDIDRATSEYTTDNSALTALVLNMRDITRFLLLNRVFGLNVFPATKPLQSTTFVGGS